MDDEMIKVYLEGLSDDCEDAEDYRIGRDGRPPRAVAEEVIEDLLAWLRGQENG